MALLLVLLCLPASRVGAGVLPADGAHAILQQQSCQTSLPLEAAPEPPSAATRDAEVAPPDDAGVDVSAAAPVLNGLGLVLLVALVVAVVAALLMRRPRTGPGADESSTPRSAAAAEPEGRLGPLPDPQELARQGRFSDAIHALLLRALAEFGRRSRAVSPSATSREIVRNLAPSPAVSTALLPLVTAVELMHFGRAPSSLEDYTACAAHYRRFTEAWRATV